jgi:(S)-ureidoglycine aminohydrolase
MHHLGLTRSANRRDHLLLTPDTFIRTPLPGLTKGTAIVHVAPQAGAAFTMMTVELELGGALTEGPTQRFLYVLEGEITLKEPGSAEPHAMTAGGYAYLPTEFEYKLQAQAKTRIVVIDKPFLPLAPGHAEELDESWPGFLIGREAEVASVPLNGDEGLQVRSLLPDSLAFDFACNTMTYAPGAALSQVEIHYMEHGLLMLEGGGIYRLGDQWYPTQAGDFIWMAPFCPQWFGAIGKQPAKYLIYKDFNRHTLA